MQDREGKEHTLEPDGVPGDLKSCAGISGVQYTHILDSCQVFNHSFYFRCLRGLPLVWFSFPPSHSSSAHFLVTRSQKKDSPHYQDQHHHCDHLCRVPEGRGDRATPTLPRGCSSHGRCRFEPVIFILTSFHPCPDFLHQGCLTIDCHQ